MQRRTLIAYLVILCSLCAGFVFGARLLGEQGNYLAGGYMFTPALAALLTRGFIHPSRFRDAYLRIGRLQDYLRFWLYSLAITALSFVLLTVGGSIRWDFSGRIFLDQLARQFAASGQDMTETLPPGFTPQSMLWIFVLGGLTVFNILPGLLTGFGEEFGHRGLMFPLLTEGRTWPGLLLGGLLWYAWHLPLTLILPPSPALPAWQAPANHIALLLGSLCTHIYLCRVFAESRSIFVPAIAHITLNNAARALACFVVIQNQFTANLMQSLAMFVIVGILYASGSLRSIPDFLSGDDAGKKMETS